MLPSLIRAPVEGRSAVGGRLTVIAFSAWRGLRLRGDQVTSTRWDAQGEAQAALRTQQLLQPEVVPGSGLDDDPIL